MKSERDRVKNPNAVALGKMGGSKGGKAKMDAMTPIQRTALAKKAAMVRWHGESTKEDKNT